VTFDHPKGAKIGVTLWRRKGRRGEDADDPRLVALWESPKRVVLRVVEGGGLDGVARRDREMVVWMESVEVL